MPLPKTTSAKADTEAEAAAATAKAESEATTAKAEPKPDKGEPAPVDLAQVLGDFMASMREVQESVRADRERIEELQLANGLVIRQGAPDNEPTTNPPDDSYIDPAQFDPSNMDFKI